MNDFGFPLNGSVSKKPSLLSGGRRSRVLSQAHAISAGARRKRVLLISVPASLWILLVAYRLVSLQITDVARWNELSQRQHTMQQKLAPERGPITDREGRLLAVSVPAGSVYVRPAMYSNDSERDSAARQISNTLGIEKKEVLSRFKSAQPFVWIVRQIPRAKAESVEKLGLKGVGYVLESRRYHPYGSAASTLLGKVGIDGNGLSGLELGFDHDLKGDHLKQTFQRDALGKEIETDPYNFALPKGEPLQLTIDADLQLILDEELDVGRVNASAKHAFGVLIDSESGEVLSMGQSPQIDLNSTSSVKASDLKNLLLETVYEPGSTFKPIVAAAAIEEKLTSADEVIDCEHGSFRFGKHNINDVHPYDKISFHDVIVRSSNIGMTKIGARLGAERLHHYLTKFGMGQSSNLGLKGESAGILRPVKSWAAIDVATHSFGQGIAVNPLQMVRAIAAISNGGTLPQLRLVNSLPRSAERVISERTARIVQQMMYGVVEDEHGTGLKAALPGVRVGGKTGTAQKARKDGRGYEQGAYVASFVGFANPVELGLKRNLTAIIVIDEPKGGTIYGGTVAAPVFKRVMQRSIGVLAMRENLSAKADDLIRPPDLGHKESGASLLEASFRPL